MPGVKKVPMIKSIPHCLDKDTSRGWKARQNRAGVPLVTIKSAPPLCWKKLQSCWLPEGRPNNSWPEQTLSFYRARKENGIICSIVDI